MWQLYAYLSKHGVSGIANVDSMMMARSVTVP